jgi:putative transcriptional regulator
MTRSLDRSGVSSYLDVMRNDVRALRGSRELSQGALGAALGVSRQTVNAIETGRYLPSLPLALKLARYFGQPVESIFHDDCGGPR